MPKGALHGQNYGWPTVGSMETSHHLSLNVGDGVVFYVGANGLFTTRQVNAGEVPQAIVVGGEEIAASSYLFLTSIDGLHAVLPSHNTPLYWRLNSRKLSLVKDKDGILAGFIFAASYNWPVAPADGPLPNHVYVVPVSETKTSITVSMPGADDGDVVVILNPADSKTRLGLTDGKGNLSVNPGDHLSIKWVAAKNQWQSASFPTNLFHLDCNVSAKWIQDHAQRKIVFDQGPIIAESSNLKTQRKTVTWTTTTNARSGTALTYSNTILTVPDVNAEYIGLCIEVVKSPGTSTEKIEQRSYALLNEGGGATTGPHTLILLGDRGSNTTRGQLGVYRDGEGKFHVEWKPIQGESNHDLGADFKIRLREMVANTVLA